MGERRQERPAAGAAMAVDIRWATAEDADILAGLCQELLAFYGLPSPNPRAYIAHTISTGAFQDGKAVEILLAFEKSRLGGERPAGLLAFTEFFTLATCQRSLFIQDIFVTRRARGRSVGRALMGRLATVARERNVTQIDWTTDPWNEQARRFYDQLANMLTSDKIFYRLAGQELKNFIKKSTQDIDQER